MFLKIHAAKIRKTKQRKEKAEMQELKDDVSANKTNVEPTDG